MAKKSSALSQPARLVTRRSEDINSRKWTKKEGENFRRIAERQAAGDDSTIDLSDIPAFTDEQLASMVRFSERNKVKIPVSVRLDQSILEWLKSKGPGHLTRINDILLLVMQAEQRERQSSSRRGRPGS